MIEVKCIRQLNFIQEVIVSGHANFKAAGQDIVCAGASAVTFGIMNALEEMDDHKNFKITKTKNEIKIQIINANEYNQVILQTMMYQLRTIEHEYENYLKVKEL